jgi:hypothetical protein
MTKLRVSQEMSGLEKLESEFFRNMFSGKRLVGWLVRHYSSIGKLGSCP